MSQLKSGDLFAERYQFTQRLNVGGFSEVWMATDRLAHDAVVVVKMFAPEQGLTESGLETFRRDVITIVPLEQKNLLKPLHFDVVATVPYIVLPSFTQGSLADQILENPAQFTEARLVQLLAEIGSALAFMHERVPPMLHTALTPHDILLTDDGHFMLADFWRSRELIDILSKSTGLPSKTNLAYASPESFRPLPSVTTAGDIFALGMIVYQLATGTDPCSGSGGLALVRGVTIPKLPDGFDAELCILLQRCLSVDPEQRPSAQELVQWANGYLKTHQAAGVPRQAPSFHPASPPQLAQPQRATTNLLPVGVLLGCLLLVGLFIFSRQPKENSHAAGGGGQVNIILRLHGSNTIGSQLAPMLAEAFLRRLGAYGIARRQTNPDEMLVRATLKGKSTPQAIEVCAHGSATAFEDLGKGVCNIGMASRRVKDDERAKLHNLGDMTAPACEHVLALDGIAIIVYTKNSLNEISKDTAAKIFSGEITNWSALGRSAGTIHVYSRDDKSGTYDTFKNLVLGNDRKLTPTAQRFESNEELRQTVSNDPDGIGFCSISFVKGVKALAVSDGSKAIMPSTFSVATEDYPLARRLFFYTPAQSSNLTVQEFIEFALSKEGQDLANTVGFVGQNITAVPVDRKTRLNFSFRFQSGSTQLDNKARNDIDRLVAFLHDARSAKQSVILSGYTDNQGDQAKNLKLSMQRAQAVAALLTARGIPRVIARGYGAENPVASNTTQDGRLRNRRVEVWLE